MKIAVYEKEASSLTDWISQYASVNKIKITISVFDNLDKIISGKQKYCCYFIDIPLSNDIVPEIMKLTKSDNCALFIYTSLYLNFAIKAIELNAFRFLLKPIEKKHFFMTMNDLCNFMNTFSMVIEDSQKLKRKININRIFYIEKYNRSTIIYFERHSIITYIKIKEWSLLLNPTYFLSAGRGTLVNIKNIDYLYNQEITFFDYRKIYVSRLCIKELTRRFYDYLDSITF